MVYLQSLLYLSEGGQHLVPLVLLSLVFLLLDLPFLTLLYFLAHSV